MPAYSTVILTLNEERDLPRCLASLATCDDVVILDSGSKDATADIARKAGARVFTRPFDTFAGQRNFAQAAIPFRHGWLLHLDADERMTPELDAECRALPDDPTLDGCYLAPRMLWNGRWIPRSTDYPAYQARFVRVPEFRFIDVGHGQREAPGMRLATLRSSYLHDLSSGGEEEWLRKHRRYAAQEARLHAASPRPRWRDLFARDRLARRRALKRWSYLLPGRPLLRFAYQYLLRGGCLDGREGLRYCRLLARYEGFTTEELRRLRRD